MIFSNMFNTRDVHQQTRGHPFTLTQQDSDGDTHQSNQHNRERQCPRGRIVEGVSNPNGWA